MSDQKAEKPMHFIGICAKTIQIVSALEWLLQQ